MAKLFLTNLDLGQNELQRAKVHNVGALPSTGTSVTGQIVYLTTDNKFYVFNGTAWIDARDRANHSGTQLAATISDFDSQVRTSRLDQMAQPTADVPFNSRKITGLADPTNPQDAATMSYVDAARSGLDVKASVRAASIGANLTLSGPQTIDGVSVIAGDRVLVKDQTTGSQNGIYVAAAGAWARSTDADVSAEVTPGMFAFVEEGTLNADTGWVLSTNAPITLNTTALVFVQFSSAGLIIAGNALVKTGNTIDVVPAAGGGISVAADSISVDTAVVVTKFAVDVGDGSSTAITVTHNLNTRDILVGVYQKATPWAEVECDIEHASVNTAILRFNTAPTSAQYRCVVHA